MKICGVDPGMSGGIVTLSDNEFEYWTMPLKDKDVNFFEFSRIVNNLGHCHIFIERAIPMAMGAKHAFNYGRNFMALEIAIMMSSKPVTYVEPNKWTKVMHDGISSDLKAKAKSIIAVERLFPRLIEKIPTSKKNKKLHEGIVDALLIAGYGKRIIC